MHLFPRHCWYKPQTFSGLKIRQELDNSVVTRQDKRMDGLNYARFFVVPRNTQCICITWFNFPRVIQDSYILKGNFQRLKYVKILKQLLDFPNQCWYVIHIFDIKSRLTLVMMKPQKNIHVMDITHVELWL